MSYAYLNTNEIEQFVGFLMYTDLEPWQGRFNTPSFVKMVRQWNADEVKWEPSREFRNALNPEQRG
jgi:hypothetical protein